MLFENITRLARDTKTFACSSENPTGEKGGGSRGTPRDKLRPCTTVQPGETLTLAALEGSGVIEDIWIGGDTGWQFILRFYWDGQSYPSVEAPLPAFFGYGYNNNVPDINGNFPTLNSAMFLVAPCRGLNSYWPMPFRRGCRITLENRGKQPMTTYYTITGQRCPVEDDCAYFHASYRQAHPVAQDEEYVIIDGIAGAGHYVGTALFVGLNGGNNCWVEGEAKMFIDGDDYPSINYTGTEDYFCGSFAFGNDSFLQKYQTYSGAYAGFFAVMGDHRVRYNCQPRYMLYRWHVPDPIHFSQDFRMTLQNIHYSGEHGWQCRRDDYASMAYWYQSLPSAPLRPLPDNQAVDMT